jgi:uncharacterized membrane protein YdjX (TVP38/TMEM64 family)
MRWGSILRGLLTIAALAGLGYLFELSQHAGLFNQSWIDAQVRGRGVVGELLFLAVGAGFTAVGLPRQFVCFLGGYGFGLMVGSLLGLIATELGCILSFYAARLIGSKAAGRLSAKFRGLDAFVSANTFTATVLIRFLPAGSNVFTNLAAGVSTVPAVPFFLGSAVGFIPQTLVFALVGSGINLNPLWRTGSAVVLFLASGALGLYLLRHYRRAHRMSPDLERELDAELHMDAEGASVTASGSSR